LALGTDPGVLTARTAIFVAPNDLATFAAVSYVRPSGKIRYPSAGMTFSFPFWL